MTSLCCWAPRLSSASRRSPETCSPTSRTASSTQGSDMASEVASLGAAAEAGEPSGGDVRESQGGGRLSLDAFLHNRRVMVGAGVVVLIGLFCFAGPLFYHASTVLVN